MNDPLVCSERFFPVSGQGRLSKISPANELKVGADGLVLAKDVVLMRFEGETIFNSSKPILQTDLKSSNSMPTVVKDQQDGAQFRWRTNAWEVYRRINFSQCCA